MRPLLRLLDPLLDLFRDPVEPPPNECPCGVYDPAYPDGKCPQYELLFARHLRLSPPPAGMRILQPSDLPLPPPQNP